MAKARLQLPFHALVAIVLTWPLARHLTDSLPEGVEQTGTVPLFNLWTLRWNQVQIGDLLRHYWDAPIFHPASGAFALSEAQPLTGAFFAPISALTHNPVLAYNCTLLTILMLNGWATTRLARHLGVAPWPAALTGVLAQALPFVANQLGVIQLTVLFPMIFLLDALLRWAADGGRRTALAMGWWLAATFLTCGYYGLFVTVVFGLVGLTLVRRSWFRRSRLLDLVLATALFAVLALPMLVGQARYTSAFSRSDQTIEGLSAMPVDYLMLLPGARGSTITPWLSEGGGSGHWLYPGTALLGLAIAGGVVVVRDERRRRAARRDGVAASAVTREVDAELDTRLDARRRAMLVCVNGAALALLLSLGLRVDIGGFHPYDIVRYGVPGFRDLRSPYRFAVLVQIFLLPPAAIALDRLWSWRPPVTKDRPLPRVGAGAVIAVTLVVVGLAEVVALPARTLEVDRSTPDWSVWLRDHGESGSGDGSVAMVPFPVSGAVEAYEPTARWMLDGLDHGRPIVNGYSGLFPPAYDEMERAMRSFPSETSVRHLRDAGVSYVVVDRAFLTPEAQGWMHDWSHELQPVFEGRDAIVYRLNR